MSDPQHDTHTPETDHNARIKQLEIATDDLETNLGHVIKLLQQTREALDELKTEHAKREVTLAYTFELTHDTRETLAQLIFQHAKVSTIGQKKQLLEWAQEIPPFH